jgi:nucleoside-triphosphatase THEP1
LQSILYVENGDYEGANKQMTIYDISPEYRENTFDVAELEEDYDNIMHGRISRTDGYKHYIIVYEKEHHEISNIEMLLLDKDFVVVDKISLMEYVNPDFASLTEDVYENIENTKEDEVEAKPLLLKLKPGVKPELKAIAEEA